MPVTQWLFDGIPTVDGEGWRLRVGDRLWSREELERLTLPFDDGSVPSDAELRIAQAQLVGWLEGLFHGIQATLFAQQMAARAQLEEMHRPRLPAAGESGLARPPGYL